ncbi:cell wall hydrolase [Johnsonella ignava]|uniref:cell wall hydrolase n=1 Tax=Johnsonella ignava TaxID=43995 RepID=UPI0023EFC439|nr:cell wall hydrolase [Johnsonella ignava]
MPKFTGIIKKVCNKLRSFSFIPVKITKEMYRNFAVIICGAVVVAAISFACKGFAGSGKNAATAHITRAKDSGDALDGQDSDDEETLLDTIAQADKEFAENSHTREIPGESDGVIKDRINYDILAMQKEYINEIYKNKDNENSENTFLEKAWDEEKVRYYEGLRKNLGIPSFSQTDYDNLCRIVESEANICNIKGRILVADVIINRVKSKAFPDTVSSVILSSGQFTTVSEGTFYTLPISTATKKAVDRALNGEDYSKGALYFISHSGKNTYGKIWIRNNFKYLFSYEGHDFYK